MCNLRDIKSSTYVPLSIKILPQPEHRIPEIFDLFNFAQSATLSEKINTLGTVRGRAGLLWGPSTLVYVTGGVAFANVTATTASAQPAP